MLAALANRQHYNYSIIGTLIIGFLISTTLSILLSNNIYQSFRLSVVLVPAILLFFLINQYFKSCKEIRLLYLTLSILALTLASLLLWTAWVNPDMTPFDWVSKAASPILIVKNDVTFISIISPLSLSLLFYKRFSIEGMLAAFSILLSVITISVFQSRVAVLSMLCCIMCFFILFRPKLSLIFGSIFLILVLIVDFLLGFPLVARFIDHWDGTGRIPLWLSAWKLFLDAPFFGHGPNTFVLFYQQPLHNLNLPSWLFIDNRVIPWAHNLYLEVLAERGVFGFISLVLLLFYGFFTAWKVKKAKLDEIRIFGCGIFAALLGFSFAALIELTFLRQWVVIMVFTLLGIISKYHILHKEGGEEKCSDIPSM